MATSATPASIEIWDSEREWLVPDLDLVYIDGAAADIAATIAEGNAAEVAYQPGDGTFYGLVFTPLATIVAARRREKNGIAYGIHALRGMKEKGGDDAGNGAAFYGTRGVLISHVEGGANAVYPLILQDGEGWLASDYVAQHWNDNAVSAVSLALLFRAVAHHYAPA